MAQTKQRLSVLEKEFCKNDIKQYNLEKVINSSAYDSVITIHYKGGLYVFAKNGDSLEVFQNLRVDKIKNPANKKTVKQVKISRLIYRGLMDTFIINRETFLELYSLGNHPQLNNPSMLITESNPESHIDRFYFEAHDNLGNADTLMLDPTEIRRYKLIIQGWQLKRLILQLYINYNHWLLVDNTIKKLGKGYYLLNNLILFNAKYFYDGKNTFTQTYSKEKYTKYFPFQFVVPKAPKPDNKYLLLPNYPKGITLEDR